MKKGIDKDTIENTLESMDNSVEEETAYNLAIKKYRILSKKENDKYKLNQKLIRFLLGKGYDYGLIKNVIKKVTNEEVEANYE